MKKKYGTLNEGMYDFYEKQGKEEDELTDKIVDYYLDKMRKYGKDSLTEIEARIFKDAQDGRLTMGKPVYAKDKVTGDILLDDFGNPVVIDEPNKVYPGIPFLTSRGMGEVKKEAPIAGRCYWNNGSTARSYYVFDKKAINSENPYGIIIYKTESKTGKAFGSFMVPKNKELTPPADLWLKCEDDFDFGAVLTKEIYETFINFYNLYHTSKKENLEEITKLYDMLKKFPQK